MKECFIFIHCSDNDYTHEIAKVLDLLSETLQDNIEKIEAINTGTLVEYIAKSVKNLIDFENTLIDYKNTYDVYDYILKNTRIYIGLECVCEQLNLDVYRKQTFYELFKDNPSAFDLPIYLKLDKSNFELLKYVLWGNSENILLRIVKHNEIYDDPKVQTQMLIY